ncbi:MAG: AAA family ATPase, partial [Nitrososphaerota archaeon]
MKPDLILCITGMPGAGKTTAARALQRLGFELISLGDVVREEASRRGLEPTDANLGSIMLQLREESGPGIIAQLAMPKIASSDKRYVV